MIHLADYSRTWEDLFKRHLDAYEILKFAAQTYPSLIWPKANFAELNLCMRVLAEEPKREPRFAENISERLESHRKKDRTSLI